MQIKNINLKNRGAFVIKRDNERIAELSYKKVNGTIDLDHTEVDENLRGQGIGKQLVEAAVMFARENKLKITASCPFASKVLSRNPEYSDVFSSSSL